MRPEQLSILKVLWRSGTQQSDRLNPALDPTSVRLMELDPNDWMLFAQNFARFIPFFSEQFPSEIIGYWTKFFEQVVSESPLPQKGTVAFNRVKEQLRQRLELLEAESNLTPHLGLMYTFFKLMDFPKNRFNQLATRHLDFYYKDILKLKKQSANSDQVYLIVELAKVPQVRIPKGTDFEAGKDVTGKKLVYKSTGEFFPNLAKIAALKNRYTDGNAKQVVISHHADSFDGRGADFPQDLSRWWPFGHVLENPSLQRASFGFTLAAAPLKSPEGARRHFCFVFSFQEELSMPQGPNKLTAAEIASLFTLEVSGKKGWISIKPAANTGLSGFTSEMVANRLQLSFSLNENLPEVVDATENLHGNVGQTGVPIIRFSISPTTGRGFDFLRILAGNLLVNVTVKSSVQGIHAPLVENDFGVLQAGKPFMPFTAVPKKGSSFYLDEPSWRDKRLTKISLHLKWANTPESFKGLYFGYRNLTGQNFSKNTYVAQNFVGNASVNIKSLLLDTNEFKNALKNKSVFLNQEPSNLLVSGDSYFSYGVSIRDSVNWNELPSTHILFSNGGQDYVTDLTIADSLGIKANKGIKLTLNQSFLHELYPKLYALAMASEQPETLIPNEPYTPLVEQVTLGYETSDSFSMDQDTSLKLYLWDDFGFFEELKSKKDALNHVSPKRTRLVSFPDVNGGELFLQLTDLQPNQQLSILFQLVEGSENPLHATFGPSEKITWSMLVNDYWWVLRNEDIVSDETDNFLKSGIIVFNLPEAAFAVHTRMSAPGVWLRAYSSKPFDATCQFVAVLPQAIKVEFTDRENDLSHLEKGLPPEAIGKMAARLSGVKSIYQPFNSYGGRPEESDSGFYTRVSERLRHKNRALSLWDYEHLVLERFPEVFKVKCLNHTNQLTFTAPGTVLVLVIPDTVGKNVFDTFQPLFSTAKLNEIKAYLQERISPSVEVLVDNPSYEEVRISLKVKFRAGLDVAFYRNQLEQDIIRYLSPWAMQSENTIAFGVNLQESLLIHQLEKLTYLEYLQDLVMFKNNQPHRKRVDPSSPKHILVSAKHHTIQPL